MASLLRMLLSAGAALPAIAAGAAVPAGPADLAFENVTVIDPEGRRSLPNHTVVVRGDTIVSILDSPSAPGAVKRRIDARGKYLIPGLVDMHVHLFLPEPAEPTLNLMLANGITSIREMSSDCWAVIGMKKGCIDDYRAVRDQVRSQAIAGPEVLGLTSVMVMGPSRGKLPAGAPSFVVPTTAADGRALVDHLAARGPSLIKTHDSISLPVFEAMMERARETGIKVGGHVPFAAGSLGAAKMGYTSIEHARDLLYDCSRFGPELRAREAAVVDQSAGAKRPPEQERLRRTVDEFDPALCTRLMSDLAETGVYYVPTHVTREMEARARDTAYRGDPARAYIAAERNGRWEKDLVETAAKSDPEAKALADFFAHGLRVTGLAHRAGIPIMVGTDTSDTMIIPGFAFHREMGLLRDSGLSEMDVLRAATVNPARYFDKIDRLGGIAVGKEADLVLLIADPLADIANTTAIDSVMANGRLYDRKQLDALLASAKDAAAKPVN